jgi:hypothetical protein
MKIKDGSLTHEGSSLVNDQPFISDSFSLTGSSSADNDDTTPGERMMAGSSGVVTNVSAGSTGKISSTGWHIPSYTSSSTPSTTLTSWVETLIRTKKYTVLTPVAGAVTIPLGGVSLVTTPSGSTPVSLSSISFSGSGDHAVVLVVTADATHTLAPLIYTGATLNTTPAAPSLLIASSSLTFSHPADVSAHGIFLTQTLDTGTGSTLKIKGNLICTGSSCTLSRSRTDQDHARPSTYIVTAPTLYLSLLPYFESEVEWR